MGVYEVRIVEVMGKSRRIVAASVGEAAVAMADLLDHTGQAVIRSGTEAVVVVRRAGERVWSQVTLTAVDITQYHPTEVRRLLP